MNYSATDSYHTKYATFRKKRVQVKDIRKRWFRNFYVMYQFEGWFTHNTFLFNLEELADTQELNKYAGEWYGPFTRESARQFATDLKETHINFIMGG